MGRWAYLVPTFQGSPWDKPGQTAYVRPDDWELWPTIGVYCPHQPIPYLLGSFAVDADVLAERGTVYWAWDRDYLTGDGRTIALGRRSGKRGTYLVGDDLYDRRALQGRLSEALDTHGPGSAEATEALRSLEAAMSQVRAKVDLDCQMCGMSARFRSERLQEPLTALWRSRMRELTLGQLKRAYGASL